MIVTSGALVLVAIALLIGGLASSGLTLVWASIAVSLVSAVCLAVGVYQRRNEVPGDALDTPAAPQKSDEIEAVRTVTGAALTATGNGQASVGGTVYVVEGRPRYHAAGCRYLAGKDAEKRSLSAARTEGYNACGVCKPDDADAATAASASDSDESSGAVKLTKAPTTTAPAKPTAAAKKATSRTTAATAKAAPAKKSAAKATAAKTTATKKSAPAKTAVKKATATKAPAKTAAKKTAAKKTPAKKTAAKKSALG